jgi:hypothetical protein
VRQLLFHEALEFRGIRRPGTAIADVRRQNARPRATRRKVDPLWNAYVLPMRRKLRAAMAVRKKVRWRTELDEIVAATGDGIQSTLESMPLSESGGASVRSGATVGHIGAFRSSVRSR